MVKIRKKSVLLSECSVGALAETALWILPKGWHCAVGAKANVPFAGWHKIELKKMCGGENKKYRSVGNECRLTRCPFVISFLCPWSLVKMVYFFLVLVSRFIVVVSSNMLAGNALAALRSSSVLRLRQTNFAKLPVVR